MIAAYNRLGKLKSLPSLDEVIKKKQSGNLSDSAAAKTVGSMFQKMLNTVKVAEELQSDNLLGKVDQLTMVRATVEAELAIKAGTSVISKIVQILKEIEKLPI